MKILFAGCGDIAERIAALIGDRAELIGVRRRAEKIPAPIRAYSIDLSAPLDAGTVLDHYYDYVVITLTPSERSIEGYRRAYVEASEQLLARLLLAPPKRIFYVSSTSVYGQRQHEWVDELSPAEAQGTGAILRHAEKIWLTSPLAVTVLRLSGIYGRSTPHMLDQVASGAVAPPEPHYSNRIHVDDAAAAIAYLMDLCGTGQTLAPLYIVSDDEPALLGDIVVWIRQQLSLEPLAASIDAPELVRRAGSKRLSNRLLKATGFQCSYPSYREGYRDALASFCS